MPIHRVKKFMCAFLFALITAFIPPSLFPQGTTIDGAQELLRILENRDTNKACKLTNKVLSRKRVYLIAYSGPIPYPAEVTVLTSNPRFDTTAVSPFRFELPIGPARIVRFKLRFPQTPTPMSDKDYPFEDSWQTREIMHIKLMIDHNGLAVLPPPVERIRCPQPCPGGFLDKPVIPLWPSHEKISVLTLSFGAIAGGTYLWFRSEKGNAEDNYEQYQKAPTSSQAVELKSAVENSRTRRDIAGAISFAASVTFAALLARDLFFRKDHTETCALIPSTTGSRRKFHFSLEPSIMDKGMKISMNMKL